jgi:hypothetical protein
MNANPSTQPDDDASKEAFKSFFADAAAAQAEQDAFGRRAPAAMLRLARAVYGHDNSQAQTVAACLASIYNGGDARPVRLDEIRWLDWSLQRDLVTVLVGTGHAGFEDTAIRKAFEAIAGPAGADFLHWYSTGGPHKAALRRLVQFAAENADGSVRELLLSLRHSSDVKVSLAAVQYLDTEITRDFILVLDGMFGRDKGVLTSYAIDEALKEFKTALPV